MAPTARSALKDCADPVGRSSVKTAESAYPGASRFRFQVRASGQGYPCKLEPRYLDPEAGVAKCGSWPIAPNSELPKVDLAAPSNEEVGNAEAICWDHSASL